MRLIDADALSVKVEESKHKNPHGGLARLKNEHNHFWRMINDAPTVDAVEVVRCKDCAWGVVSARNPLIKWCNKHATHFRDNDFCSYGERKEQ